VQSIHIQRSASVKWLQFGWHYTADCLYSHQSLTNWSVYFNPTNSFNPPPPPEQEHTSTGITCTHPRSRRRMLMAVIDIEPSMKEANDPIFFGRICFARRQQLMMNIICVLAIFIQFKTRFVSVIFLLCTLIFHYSNCKCLWMNLHPVVNLCMDYIFIDYLA